MAPFEYVFKFTTEPTQTCIFSTPSAYIVPLLTVIEKERKRKRKLVSGG